MVALNIKLKLFWMSCLCDGTAVGMFNVAFYWLAVKNYGVFGFALTSLGYAIANLTFILLGGIATDRFNKQRLLQLSQVLFITVAIPLTIICAIKTPTLWFLVLISILNGFIAAFNSPSRYTIYAGLGKVLEVNQMEQIFGFAGSLGAVIGSLLASVILPIDSFIISNHEGSLAFALYIFGMIPMIFLIPKEIISLKPFDQIQKARSTPMNIYLQFKNAFNYINSIKKIQFLIIILFCVLILGQSFTQNIAIFAHTKPVFLDSSKLFSHVFAALGAGTFFGALIGIFLAESNLKNPTMFVYMIFLLCISAIISLLTSHYWVAIFAIMFVGLFATLCINLLMGVIQSLSREDMGGRVSSFTGLFVSLCNVTAGMLGLLIYWLAKYMNGEYEALMSIEMALFGMLATLAIFFFIAIKKAQFGSFKN
jgi:MFS family permease